MKPSALREVMPRGGWLSCLPPVRRAPHLLDASVEEAPQNVVLNSPLVDRVAEVVLDGVRLSRGKARKAIRQGQVKVNGVVVRDPDVRTADEALVEFLV